jgi:hypothetical protein
MITSKRGLEGTIDQMHHALLLVTIILFVSLGAPVGVLLGSRKPRLVAYAPGEPSVTATNGSFFPIGPSKAMLLGQVTSLGLETDPECGADGGAATGVLYRHVRVYLRRGVIDVALSPRMPSTPDALACT